MLFVSSGRAARDHGGRSERRSNYKEIKGENILRWWVSLFIYILYRVYQVISLVRAYIRAYVHAHFKSIMHDTVTSWIVDYVYVLFS